MVQLATRRIATGLANPLFLTAPPGDRDRLFILEQKSGAIKILDTATETIRSTPFLTIPGNELLNTGFEQGLLGLAFHPNYGSNGKFYVSYTAPGGGNAGQTKVVEYQVSAGDPNLANPTPVQTILTINQPQENHNGGWLAFGQDGYLYWASGDGGGSGFQPGIPDESDNSQDLTANLLGKILRLDINGDDFPSDPNRNYRIPASNPLVGQPGDDEIWSFGLRNPWRPSSDRLTGDLYIADVGQGRREEVNIQPATSAGGENYGWNLYEGTLLYKPGDIPAGLTFPVYEYDRTQGQSVTGGYVYRGIIPELRGTYFFGDFSSSRLGSFRYTGSTITELTDRTAELTPSGGGTIDNIASFGEDALGNLYIIDLDGEIFLLEVEPTPTLEVQSIFNFAQFARFQALDEGIQVPLPPAAVNGIHLALLFDETFYLASHPDVASAVRSGALASGFDHFRTYGVNEGRDPSVLFDEVDYLTTNPDVAIAVSNGQVRSGLAHYLTYGVLEGRDPSAGFDEQDYLLANPSVQTAVTQGLVTNGFDHYLEFGAAEGRGPQLFLFQERFYLSQNLDVVQAVTEGSIADGLEHYIRFGQRERRDPSPLFDESAYLETYGDVANAVSGGSLASGFEHFIKYGRFESRVAIALVG